MKAHLPESARWIDEVEFFDAAVAAQGRSQGLDLANGLTECFWDWVDRVVAAELEAARADRGDALAEAARAAIEGLADSFGEAISLSAERPLEILRAALGAERGEKT